MSNRRTLKQDVKNAAKYSLSSDDIRRSLNNDVSILLYEDLANVDDIRSIFEPSNNVVLLYPDTQYNQGHWVALMYFPERSHIIYFDPYNLSIRKSLEYSRHLHNKPYILALPELLERFLLSSAGTRNNTLDLKTKHRMQVMTDNISTCGRHVISRIIHRDLSNEEYERYLVYDKLNPDEIVSLITVDTLPG